MNNPKYSFIASSIRSNYYSDYYDSINCGSNVPFEVVFVGPNPPTEKMPDNFRYVETNVKPAQCFEIAARESRGDYLIWSADDLRHCEGFLRRLDQYNDALDDNNTLIAFRATLQNNYVDTGLVFDKSILGSPVVGFGGLFRRDLFNELGGLDKRFYGSFADVDMQMRIMSMGRNIFIPPDCIYNEIKPQKHENKKTLLLYRCNTTNARPLLNSLWVNPDRTMSKTRLSPVQSFSDEDILVRDQ